MEVRLSRTSSRQRLRATLGAGLSIAGLALILGSGASAIAQSGAQRTFSSAEKASTALYQAVKDNDAKALRELLGPDAEGIISTGDDPEDREGRALFVSKYEQMHRLVKEPDGTTTLYVGAENWPTPIPLVNREGSWHFDAEAAKEEIVYRRIGRNETSAVRVCEELVAAQKEYFAAYGTYASRIVSDDRRRNGLHWRTADGSALPDSPVGPLVASAVPQSYAPNRKAPASPFRGYYFHMLKRQGGAGPGGAKEYIVDDKMTEGFAFVAYPAEYRSSGVMTFIVGPDGRVYEKDLGPQTAMLGKQMEQYDPDSTWREVRSREQSPSPK